MSEQKNPLEDTVDPNPSVESILPKDTDADTETEDDAVDGEGDDEDGEDGDDKDDDE
jgi:hypothetical protein